MDSPNGRSRGRGRWSGSGGIWKVEPRGFPDEWDTGMRGKKSRRTLKVWPESLEGWSCHRLRRSGLWVEQIVEEDQEFSAGHAECEMLLCSHQNQVEMNRYTGTSSLSPGRVSYLNKYCPQRRRREIDGAMD